MGYKPDYLETLNRKAVRLLHDMRAQYASAELPIIIHGCLGPKGDAYDASQALSASVAQQYHADQIRIFREEGVDLVTAMTLTSSDEAIGVTKAAQAENLPVVISFTLETDGRLPSGQTLIEAISHVDAAAGEGLAYYIINCAHPTHFLDILRELHPAFSRIQGIRANASCKSHAELDEATELDIGNPHDLGQRYLDLHDVLSNIKSCRSAFKSIYQADNG